MSSLRHTYSLFVLAIAALCAAPPVAADSYVATIELYEGDTSCSGSFYGGRTPSTILFYETKNLTDCTTYAKDFGTSFALTNLTLDVCTGVDLYGVAYSMEAHCSPLVSGASLNAFATLAVSEYTDHLAGKLWVVKNMTQCYFSTLVKSNVTVLTSHYYTALELCLPGKPGESLKFVPTENRLSLVQYYWNTTDKCVGTPSLTNSVVDACTTAGSFLWWPASPTDSSGSTSPPIGFPGDIPIASTEPTAPIASTEPVTPIASTEPTVPVASTEPAAPVASTSPDNSSVPVSSPAAIGSSGTTLKPFAFFGSVLASMAFIFN